VIPITILIFRLGKVEAGGLTKKYISKRLRNVEVSKLTGETIAINSKIKILCNGNLPRHYTTFAPASKI